MSRRILALDVGEVRIGVALSDPLGMFAQPHAVLDRRRVDPWAEIVKILGEYGVDEIVVGQPLHLSGRSGAALTMVEEFVKTLRIHTTLPIVLWDERLTTVAAERSMIEAGARREERRGKIDKVAAALLLQTYLDKQKP